MSHEPTETPIYKAMLRQRLTDLKKGHGYRLTNEKLAEALKIEPAYLSRCLNHPQQHPSRDLLFRLSRSIGLDPMECETVLTQFDLTQASSKSYHQYLRMKLRVTEANENLKSIAAVTGWIEQTAGSLSRLQAELRALEEQRLTRLPTKVGV